MLDYDRDGWLDIAMTNANSPLGTSIGPLK